ncbi:glycosyltransferase [Roseibium aggregatum]|uniref:glycosyltransferase n=1 Tax=Roseibium aggregatum TaxID=187304 RepID=UPI00094B593A|nr:glycosyltransferase [Roseibium aggregatum]UFI05681.1 glycosyltransferase [Roseibium aggregatum]
MDTRAEFGEPGAAAPLILHLSADYPNPQQFHRRTTAIERLVTGVDLGRHIVVTMDRTSLPWQASFKDCGEIKGVRLFSYRYFGLPMGIGLASAMRRIARHVFKTLKTDRETPALVHAHKLSFEGIAGLWLAERFGPDTRLFISVRGESERKILLFKPTYRNLMRRIAARADKIYHISAWFRDTYHRYVPAQPEKERLLPNIVGNSTSKVPVKDPIPRFVSVFDLDMRRRKGMSDLLQGFAGFQKTHPDIGLDLIGPGSAEAVEAAKKEIAELGLGDSVRILGPMNSKDLFEVLPHYLAMALVSYNETFGMVYLEALFAGLPIIYGKDTGIDGYLDDIDVGIGVKPGDVAGIAAAFKDLAEKSAHYRSQIVASEQILHDRFNPAMILESYRQDLEAVLTPDQQRSRT